MNTLTAEQIRSALESLPGWTLRDREIVREYSFDDFVAAMTFVSRVAELAEAAEHHPDIDIRYNKVTLALSTHSAGGLTKKDVELAQQIEAL
jgi:4a-hydroxytetrahydrobiopterin dehydratase